MMFNRLFGKPQKSGPVKPAMSVDIVDITGHPELDFLFIRPSAESIQSALEAWVWLDLPTSTVIAVSAFGDMFFRVHNGSIWMLDTLEGNWTQVAKNFSDFVTQLQDEGGRDRFLLGGIVLGVRSRGMILADGECYDFSVAPVIGAAIAADNVEARTFRLKVHVAGQLNEQIRRMPPGAQVQSFKISE